MKNNNTAFWGRQKKRLNRIFTQNTDGNTNGLGNKLYLLFVTTVTSFTSFQVNAQLPTPVNPSSGNAGGNYLQFMQGWTGDAIDYIALAISGAGFLWVGWILLSKFNEARSSNDPDWGSVGLTAVIAGVLLAVVSFFLNEATGII